MGPRRDQHGRVAVRDDVRGLFRRQVPVDRRVVQAGALRRPREREQLGLVAEQQRDVVAEAEALRGQERGGPVRLRAQPPVRESPAAPMTSAGLPTAAAAPSVAAAWSVPVM